MADETELALVTNDGKVLTDEQGRVLIVTASSSSGCVLTGEVVVPDITQ